MDESALKSNEGDQRNIKKNQLEDENENENEFKVTLPFLKQIIEEASPIKKLRNRNSNYERSFIP